jgi:hypothetical protein
MKDVHARYHESARCGFVETPDQVEQGSLAASRRSNERNERRRRYLKAQIFQGPDCHFADLVIFLNVFRDY